MILITGSSGYIGSHIACFFDQKNIDYIGIDNYSYSYKENVSKKEKNFKLDIAETNKIKKIIQKYNIKTIIHAAAFSYVLEGEKNKKKYFNNNKKKTKLFINFCKKEKIVNFIFLSSSNVYQEYKKINQFNENDKKKPKNFYGKNKLEIETFLKKKKFKKLVILRLFNVIGIFNKNFKFYNFNNNKYQRLLFQIQDKIYKNKTIKLNYLLENNKKIFPSRDFVDVKIICLALVELIQNLKRKKNFYKILNIGSGIATPINKILIMFEKYSKFKFNVKYKRISNYELINTRAKIDRLRKLLGKKKLMNLNESIKSHNQ